MKEFQDTAGTTWQLAVTAGTIKRVQDLLGVDLGKLCDRQPDGTLLLTRIHTDVIFLVDLIYVCCKPQADAAEISDTDFAERLGGESLLAAHQALQEELAGFFLRFGRKETAAALTKQAAIVAEGIERATEALESPEIQTLIEHRLNEIAPPGSSAANWPPSAAATPSPERSAS